MFACSHNNCRAETGQENRSLPEAQQAPWSFVTDQAVSRRQKESVKRNKARKASTATPKIRASKAGYAADQGQEHQQSFCPNRLLAMVKPKQAVKIKIPRVNMF